MNSLQHNSVTGNRVFDIPLRMSRGMEEIRITPEIAQHWLTFNATNRIFRPPNEKRMRKAMERGHWADNGETIKFAHGRLLDGQHRLTAVVLSGQTVRMIVVFGLDNESQVTMDTGRVRTPKDVLSIEGLGNWEASVFGNGVHGIISVKNGALASSNERFTNQDVRDFYLEHKASVDQSLQSLRALPRRPAILSFSRAMTFHYLFSEKDREGADVFFQGLYTGIGLAGNSPIYLLRTRLTNDLVSDKRRTAFVECGFLIKAWNAYRRGSKWRSSETLKPRDEDSLEII